MVYSKQYIIGYGTKQVETESSPAISSSQLFRVFNTGFNKIYCDKPILHKSADSWILYKSPVVITELGSRVSNCGPYEHRDLSKDYLDVDYFKHDYITPTKDYAFYICETPQPAIVNDKTTHTGQGICTCTGICNGTCTDNFPCK